MLAPRSARNGFFGAKLRSPSACRFHVFSAATDSVDFARAVCPCDIQSFCFHLSLGLSLELVPSPLQAEASCLKQVEFHVEIDQVGAEHRTLASVMPVHFRWRVKRPYATAVKRGGPLPFLNPYPLSTFTKTVRQALRKHSLLLSQTPLHHCSQPWRPSSLPQSLPPFCSPPEGVHNMYRSIIFALTQTGFVPDPHSIPVVACIACAALPGHTT